MGRAGAVLIGAIRLLAVLSLTWVCTGCAGVLDAVVPTDRRMRDSANRQLLAGDYDGARRTLHAWQPRSPQMMTTKTELVTLADKAEATWRLIDGRLALDRGEYGSARDKLRLVSDSTLLAPSEVREARDGLCSALFHVGELEYALTACGKALEDRESAAGVIAAQVYAGLLEKYRTQVTSALTAKDTGSARAG